MKASIAITAAGLMSFGIVGTTPALAWHLIPENKSFVGNGTTSATKNGVTLKCTAKFTGKINSKGVGSVTGGSFSGALGCSSVGLQGLPWTATATSATTGNILKVTFTSPIGNCGPGTLPVKLTNGVISFTNVSLPGSCKVSGNIKTTPKVSIVSGAGAWWLGACSRMHCAPAWNETTH
jgi:hypothetical protein